MERRDRVAYILITLIVGAIVSFSYTLGLWSSTELRLEDGFFNKRPISNNLVVVAIDDESIARVGQWPWPRSVYAKALTTLNTVPPKAVAIDILLSEPSRLGKEDDELLKTALQQVSYPVILGAEAKNLTVTEDGNIRATGLISPLLLFNTANTSVGLVNMISDSDGVVRSFPLTLTIGTTTEKSLAYNTMLKAGLIQELTNPKPHTRIVYGAPLQSIRVVPFYRLLEKDPPTFEHKIIFLGATATSLRDNEKTPLGGETAGISIHTEIANMLEQGLSLTPLSKEITILLIFAIAAISSFIFLYTEVVVTAIALNLLITALGLLAMILCFERGLVLNVVHLSLASLLTTLILSLYKSIRSESEKKFIKQTFSKYVSNHVLDTLMANPKSVALGGEEREITVLFSDIRGFTTLSEGLKPTELVTLLNRYFKAVTKEIINHDGVLDKYIGDAIMAFWGAPITDSNQADKAVKAGLGMLRELEHLNKILMSEGQPEIAIGIGIYSGKAVVGNVGSEFRFDYTAIGDTVNAASRIEGLTKDYKAKLIIGESTKQLLKDSEQYTITSLGEVAVKGKKETINIYSVEEKVSTV